MTDHLTNLIRAQLRADLDRDMASAFAGAVTNTTAQTYESALTMEKLTSSMKQMPRDWAPGPPQVRITFTDHALKETKERLFPASKNRSRRIHKKLVKRHGGEFRRVPTIWIVDDSIIAHPSFRSQLEARTKETNRVQMYPWPQNPLLRSEWL